MKFTKIVEDFGVLTKLNAKDVSVSPELMKFLGTKTVYGTLKCIFLDTVFGEVICDTLSYHKDTDIIYYEWCTEEKVYLSSWDVINNIFDIKETK